MNSNIPDLQQIPDEHLIKNIIRNGHIRRKVTTQSHLFFFHVYFGHYITYETADFQKEMFALTEDEAHKTMVIVAFRGSAKSTIMNLSYPLWAILGKQQKKYVLLAGQTQHQARQHLKNLKEELDHNELLRKDLGPFTEQEDEWNSYSLVLKKYGARISAISTDQAIRGLRHGAHRPDLIICDDIEDLSSVKTRENRDKTYDWLTGEVIPAGDRNTRLIVIGNLLHEDSLLMRMKDKIEQNELDGVFKAYHLMDENKVSLWPGKYPSQKDIENERKKIGNEIAWQREYMLVIIADEGKVIQPEWIQYYDELPPKEGGERKFKYAATGIDLAISQKASADYTAMVSGKIYGGRDNRKIYILPHPVNARLDFPETVKTAQNLSTSLGNGGRTKLFIEDVGYQKALIQDLEREGFPAKGVKVHGHDKRERLSLVSHMIKSGEVLFPRKGAEHLIQQLTGFGVEKHDDLSDALAILLMQLMEEPPEAKFFMKVIDTGPRYLDMPREFRDFMQPNKYPKIF